MDICQPDSPRICAVGADGGSAIIGASGTGFIAEYFGLSWTFIVIAITAATGIVTTYQIHVATNERAGTAGIRGMTAGFIEGRVGVDDARKRVWRSAGEELLDLDELRLRVVGSAGGDALRVGDVEGVRVRREVGCLGAGEAERGRYGLAVADEVADGDFEVGAWGHMASFVWMRPQCKVTSHFG